MRGLNAALKSLTMHGNCSPSVDEIVENAGVDGRKPDWPYGVVKGFYLAYGVGTADYHCLRIQTGRGLTDVSWGAVSRGNVRLSNLPPELLNLAAACHAPVECPFMKGK